MAGISQFTYVPFIVCVAIFAWHDLVPIIDFPTTQTSHFLGLGIVSSI